MKKTLIVLLILFNSCIKVESDDNNTSENIFPINVYNYTSDFRYLSISSTNLEVKNTDSTFVHTISIYKTTEEFSKQKISHKVNNLSEGAMILPIEEFIKLREFSFLEPGSNYFIDFTGTYGVIGGKINWLENEADTLLNVEYLGGKFELRIYNQFLDPYEILGF